MQIVEQGKIIWLIQTIANKFEMYCQNAFDIMHRLEYIQLNLWNKVLDYLVKDKIKNPKEYINKIQEKIVPFEMQMRLRMQDSQLRKSQNQM